MSMLSRPPGKGGIPTGSQPVAGALVVFGVPNAASYGHVAYVDAATSPTHVEISECNYDWMGGRRTIWENPEAQSEPLQGYIYGGSAGNGLGSASTTPGGSGTGGPPSGDPAAVVNSATNMNVFYGDASGDLVNMYWTNTGGWVQQVLVGGGVAGDPAAVVNSATNMNVFYRDTSGDLVNEYWTNTGGWVKQVLTNGGVAGDVAAVVNSSTNMNVFYRDTSGDLVNMYWTNTGGWVNQTLP
jgi:hypothetical protein